MYLFLFILIVFFKGILIKGKKVWGVKLCINGNYIVGWLIFKYRYIGFF